MHAGSDRLEFAPPPPPAAVRAFLLAVIAHVLLLLALTWGINWKRESESVAVEAELWSSVPQQAAPAVVQAPPLPAPVPVPAPPPPPPPRVIAPPPPPAPVPRQPDIALEREKKKQELAERRREELELKKKLEARQKREELEREKKLEALKKQEELKRQAVAEKKAAEEKKKKAEELAKAKAKQEEAKAKQEEAKLAALRKENMERMMKGAAGAPSSQGAAERASGPSDSYAGKIRARVRPNIVFTDDVAGNPMAEVEVRMAPDGTITSRKIVKSSGERSWDQAVLRALDKTEILPRDVDGRVHSPLIIQFKLKG